MTIPSGVRHTRGLRTAVVALVAGVLCSGLGACSLLGDPVQRDWESREPLPSCGEVQVEQGQQLKDVSGRAIDCLEAALASTSGAELVVTSSTTEGDPITDYYRVTPAGTTEIYTDASKDRFSDGSWHYASCSHPDSALEAAC